MLRDVFDMQIAVPNLPKTKDSDGGFKTSVDEASSAAVMLKTLKRLNQVHIHLH